MLHSIRQAQPEIGFVALSLCERGADYMAKRFEPHASSVTGMPAAARAAFDPRAASVEPQDTDLARDDPCNSSERNAQFRPTVRGRISRPSPSIKAPQCGAGRQRRPRRCRVIAKCANTAPAQGQVHPCTNEWDVRVQVRRHRSGCALCTGQAGQGRDARLEGEALMGHRLPIGAA